MLQVQNDKGKQHNGGHQHDHGSAPVLAPQADHLEHTGNRHGTGTEGQTITDAVNGIHSQTDQADAGKNDGKRGSKPLEKVDDIHDVHSFLTVTRIA